jgi:hypothetical protein
MDPRNRNLIDKYPKLNSDEKTTMRISGTSVMRRREPTNPQTASHMPNMAWDHSEQMHVFPDNDPQALVEASKITGDSLTAYKTMNKSGRPYALGVSVGGAPRDGGMADKNLKPTKNILK